MHDKPEVELITHGRQGDQAALAELFRRHYQSSLRLARAILRSEDDSQDAVQSAFVSALQHLYAFRGDSSFRTWISRIVINCCMIQRRAPWRRASWVYLDEMPAGHSGDAVTCRAPTPEKSAYAGEIQSALAQAVARLPGNLRDAFTLYCFSGLSVNEVAGILGLSRAAAKTRVFRARAKVRIHLQPVWSHEHAV